MTAGACRAEIAHSTAMLRAVMAQYADAREGDLAFLRNEALFWAGNRARARRWLGAVR